MVENISHQATNLVVLGRSICPPLSSPPPGIWQLKCPRPREFAIHKKKKGKFPGVSPRGGGNGRNWNWLMHKISMFLRWKSFPFYISQYNLPIGLLRFYIIFVYLSNYFLVSNEQLFFLRTVRVARWKKPKALRDKRFQKQGRNSVERKMGWEQTTRERVEERRISNGKKPLSVSLVNQRLQPASNSG